MCSIQNPLFKLHVIFNSVFSFLFTLPMSKKRQKNWKRNQRAFQAKAHPIYALREGGFGFFVVQGFGFFGAGGLVFWVFCVVFFCLGVFLFGQLVLVLFTTSTDIYSLQSEDTKEGRPVLVLHGSSYDLLFIFWIMHAGMAASTVLVWPNTSCR